MDRKTKAIFREIMREIGAKGGKIGGKRSLETMTPEERSARAKKAAMAAAKKRTAERLAREHAARRTASRTKSRHAEASEGPSDSIPSGPGTPLLMAAAEVPHCRVRP